MTDNSPARDEIWRWSATQIAHGVRAGEISCVEVLESFYRRIDDVNPSLNAIVYMDRERAMQEAREADCLRSRDSAALGPLHGVPVSIKLNADVAGQATSNGVTAWKDRIAPADSAVVSNLRRAGALIVGRTNVPPFSFRWFTENPMHGRTLNPWRPDITSGGSSGGAAVSAAAGMCALAHGTDIAGSIRYPAYVCGVAGLKPTPGRIPALNPSVERRFMGLQLFSSQGLLARRMEDVELGLRSMARDGHMDPTWTDVRLDFDDDTRPVRVALVDRVPGADIAPEVSAALAQAAEALKNAGYSVEAASPPDLSQALDLWLTIVMTEVELWMMSAVDATNDPAIISSVRSMSACAPAREPYAYAKALAQRDVLRQEWFRFLDRYPIVLLPTSCRAPMPWDEDLQGVDPMRQLLLDQSTLIGPAAMSLPGLNVPIAMSDGCPVGVQLLGAAFRERRLLVAGRILEQACGFPTLHGTRLLS